MGHSLKAVVTGGAGFIGSHLVERLIRDGHRVLVIDDLSNGRLENLAAVQGNPAFAFERASVADHEKVKPLFSNADWVFHLAALADIVPSIVEPLKYHVANVDSTAAVLEAARAARVKRFIYAASSSCYGLPDEFPTPETAPIKPMYPYALTKWTAEQYVLHWAKVYGLPCLSLRLFNVYGPRSRTSGTYGAVFGVFLAQKLAGQPYTIVGDGAQTRDFTYVTDVVEAFVLAAQSDLTVETFNVGSGGTYPINRLVDLLGGGPSVHIPKRPGEPGRTFADISKIRKAIGWRPKVRFEDGVGTLLKGIEAWREAPVWDEASIQEATKQWFQYLG